MLLKRKVLVAEGAPLTETKRREEKGGSWSAESLAFCFSVSLENAPVCSWVLSCFNESKQERRALNLFFLSTVLITNGGPGRGSLVLVFIGGRPGCRRGLSLTVTNGSAGKSQVPSATSAQSNSLVLIIKGVQNRRENQKDPNHRCCRHQHRQRCLLDLCFFHNKN